MKVEEKKEIVLTLTEEEVEATLLQLTPIPLEKGSVLYNVYNMLYSLINPLKGTSTHSVSRSLGTERFVETNPLKGDPLRYMERSDQK